MFVWYEVQSASKLINFLHFTVIAFFGKVKPLCECLLWSVFHNAAVKSVNRLITKEGVSFKCWQTSPKLVCAGLIFQHQLIYLINMDYINHLLFSSFNFRFMWPAVYTAKEQFKQKWKFKELEKLLIIIYLPPVWWKVGWSVLVHKKFLELQRNFGAAFP